MKIADFGLSKICKSKDDVNTTFCGSIEYMAPEMFLKKGHTFNLDYYTLGVLLYELVAGFPPFYSADQHHIMTKVLSEEVKFPNYFSRDLKDLIKSLLVKDPQKRLGSKGGIPHIR